MPNHSRCGQQYNLHITKQHINGFPSIHHVFQKLILRNIYLSYNIDPFRRQSININPSAPPNIEGIPSHLECSRQMKLYLCFYSFFVSSIHFQKVSFPIILSVRLTHIALNFFIQNYFIRILGSMLYDKSVSSTIYVLHIQRASLIKSWICLMLSSIITVNGSSSEAICHISELHPSFSVHNQCVFKFAPLFYSKIKALLKTGNSLQELFEREQHIYNLKNPKI